MEESVIIIRIGSSLGFKISPEVMEKLGITSNSTLQIKLLQIRKKDQTITALNNIFLIKKLTNENGIIIKKKYIESLGIAEGDMVTIDYVVEKS